MSIGYCGMGRLTGVAHPLERLGEVCREQTSAKSLRIERSRRRNVLKVASASLLMAAAVSPLIAMPGPYKADPETRWFVEAGAARHLSKYAMVRASAFAVQAPIRMITSRAATEAQAALLAGAGSDLPRSIEPLRERLELPLTYAAMGPEEIVPPALEKPSDELAPRPMVLLSHLPLGTSVSSGIPIEDGAWVFALSDVRTVAVTLPDGAVQGLTPKSVASAPRDSDTIHVTFRHDDAPPKPKAFRGKSEERVSRRREARSDAPKKGPSPHALAKKVSPKRQANDQPTAIGNSFLTSLPLQ